jgi:hypothetical protein
MKNMKKQGYALRKVAHKYHQAIDPTKRKTTQK